MPPKMAASRIDDPQEEVVVLLAYGFKTGGKLIAAATTEVCEVGMVQNAGSGISDV